MSILYLKYLLLWIDIQGVYNDEESYSVIIKQSVYNIYSSLLCVRLMKCLRLCMRVIFIHNIIQWRLTWCHIWIICAQSNVMFSFVMGSSVHYAVVSNVSRVSHAKQTNWWVHFFNPDSDCRKSKCLQFLQEKNASMGELARDEKWVYLWC